MTQLRLPRFSDYHCFTSTHQSGEWVVHGFITSERKDGTLLAGKVGSRPDNRKTKRPPRKEATLAGQNGLTASQKKKYDIRDKYFCRRDLDDLPRLLSRLHL